MSSTANLSTSDTANLLAELKKISKVLILANSKVIEDELLKITNSDARKKIWVLIDGNRMPKDLAEKARVTQAAVSYFLDAAAAAGLVEYTQRNPPKRVLDYVPPAWIQLVMAEETAETAKKPNADAKGTIKQVVKEGEKQ